jgi:predicted AAA+ superfamily ATPase
MIIDRVALRHRVETALARARVVVLVGPRQTGKTTLARMLMPIDDPNYLDLENPEAEAQLEQPLTALRDRTGLVVIDEVQRAPDLFKTLRVLADDPRHGARYLLLGSASPALLRQSSESLAGRIEVIEIGGFTLEEVGVQRIDRLWWRGGYPRSFIAEEEATARAWRRQFIAAFVERDLPQLGLGASPVAMRRFWGMLAHMHGQVWNAADPARSLGVSEPTVRRYLEWLTQTFMVRQLQPWFTNLGKRQVKSPKIYFRDSGLLHELLGLASREALDAHPRAGASWEGFALEQVLRIAAPDEAYFWATHAGAELDLLLFRDARRVGVEFERADAPRLTPSMQIAIRDLGLDALYVVYPGRRRYALSHAVEVVPVSALLPP